MKNKIFLLSLLVALPAAVFAADQAAAPAPLGAVVVDVRQRELDVLRELQAIRADPVQYAPRQTLAIAADYGKDIFVSACAGVGIAAFSLWFLGKNVVEQAINGPVIVISGGLGAAYAVWHSENKRKRLRTRAEQDRARLQDAANAQAALALAAQTVVNQENDARRLKEEARLGLEAANARLTEESVRHQQEEQANREALRQESERHHAAEQANQQAVRDLAGQVGTNNQGLRAVVAGQLLQIGLQRGPALVAVQMLRQSGNTADADRQQQALANADVAVERLALLEQQLALPAPAAPMAELPVTGANS